MALTDRLVATPLPLVLSPVLDVVTAQTVLLVILLALPAARRPDWMKYGSWLVAALSYIILALALVVYSQTSTTSRWAIA